MQTGCFPPMPREVYDKTIDLPFRNGVFEASALYDEFLKTRFGEKYMEELPPECKRKPSHNWNIRIKKG